MGKGTDKLYITHSEWASEDAFSANAGAGVSQAKNVNNLPFKRLPYNFCALSLQPFSHPVCTAEGTTFELTHILPWIKKHGTNPVDGKPLKSSDLVRLNFAKNEEGEGEGEYVDPVTYKPFTNNTHIIALKPSGNVFSHDTLTRLNITPKNWRDLVSDQPFTRADIITLQDPQSLASRDMSSYKHFLDGSSTPTTAEEAAQRADPTANLNLSAMGSSAKVLKAKEAVSKVRASRATTQDLNRIPTKTNLNSLSKTTSTPQTTTKPKLLPRNAAGHTTGLAAASLTSTGLTPHTSTERATLTEEDLLLKPRRVRNPGYARLTTTHGALNLSLSTEYAPRAVWNFLGLARRGYYTGVAFHRNIRSFMIQGGDPTGTGRGGESVWGGKFKDEWMQSPLSHDARGVLSMANKGRDTNTSQFFVTYRRAPHLDRKHTIFGRVILPAGGGGGGGGEGEGEAGETARESEETLRRLEEVPTDEGSKPKGDCTILDVSVLIDPFEEFRRKQALEDEAEREREEVERMGGREEDNVTWTGKRVRRNDRGGGGSGVDNGADREGGGPAVGKYLNTATLQDETPGEVVFEEWEQAQPEEPGPAKKKRKAGGFGSFDNW